MSEESTTAVEEQGDPEVLNFLGRLQNKDSFAKGAGGFISGREEAPEEPESEPEESTEEPAEQAAKEDSDGEGKPEKPKGEPDPEKAREAFLERQRKRNAKREELDAQEQTLRERERIVNAVMAGLSQHQQQQVQHLDQGQGAQIPPMEEDEAGNLDARLRRIEEREQALASFEQQRQWQTQQQQAQAAQVQNFVQQFAEDEREWMADSPNYATKSKALFEGTVRDMMAQGMDQAQALTATKQAIMGLAANAYARGLPPFELIESYGDRYLSGQQPQGKPKQKTARKQQLGQERQAVQDGAAGSLSQGRATGSSNAKIPVSVEQLREGGYSSKQINDMVGKLADGRNTIRTDLFEMIRQVEGG